MGTVKIGKKKKGMFVNRIGNKRRKMMQQGENVNAFLHQFIINSCILFITNNSMLHTVCRNFNLKKFSVQIR